MRHRCKRQGRRIPKLTPLFSLECAASDKSTHSPITRRVSRSSRSAKGTTASARTPPVISRRPACRVAPERGDANKEKRLRNGQYQKPSSAPEEQKPPPRPP